MTEIHKVREQARQIILYLTGKPSMANSSNMNAVMEIILGKSGDWIAECEREYVGSRIDRLVERVIALEKKEQ